MWLLLLKFGARNIQSTSYEVINKRIDASYETLQHNTNNFRSIYTWFLSKRSILPIIPKQYIIQKFINTIANEMLLPKNMGPLQKNELLYNLHYKKYINILFILVLILIIHIQSVRYILILFIFNYLWFLAINISKH